MWELTIKGKIAGYFPEVSYLYAYIDMFGIQSYMMQYVQLTVTRQ